MKRADETRNETAARGETAAGTHGKKLTPFAAARVLVVQFFQNMAEGDASAENKAPKERTVYERVTGRTNGWIASLYEWMGTLILSLVCVIFVFIFLFRIVGVVGPSMIPTLTGGETVEDRSGDRLLIYTLRYTPERGDIVIIDRYVQEPLIKRVIAVAGDRVRILGDEGKVMLNGVVLDEPYTSGRTLPNAFGTEEQVVPEGCVWVLGDHRSVSHDSRSEDIGFVSVKDIVGKAVFRFAPLDRIGIVKQEIGNGEQEIP